MSVGPLVYQGHPESPAICTMSQRINARSGRSSLASTLVMCPLVLPVRSPYFVTGSLSATERFVAVKNRSTENRLYTANSVYPREPVRQPFASSASPCRDTTSPILTLLATSTYWSIVGAHYAASKAGLHGLMYHLTARVARHGVTVNALAPALIGDTRMLPTRTRPTMRCQSAASVNRRRSQTWQLPCCAMVISPTRWSRSTAACLRAETRRARRVPLATRRPELVAAGLNSTTFGEKTVQHQLPTSTDVLIVGAGPTGITLAISLNAARAGLRRHRLATQPSG